MAKKPLIPKSTSLLSSPKGVLFYVSTSHAKTVRPSRIQRPFRSFFVNLFICTKVFSSLICKNEIIFLPFIDCFTSKYILLYKRFGHLKVFISRNSESYYFIISITSFVHESRQSHNGAATFRGRTGRSETIISILLLSMLTSYIVLQ